MRRLILVLSIVVAAPIILFTQVYDFQVNIAAGSGIIPHNYPRLVPRPDGGVLVLWEDSRNGTEQTFGQFLLVEGDVQGGNFLISETPLNLDSNSGQAVGFDAAGRMVKTRIEYQENGYIL